MSSLFHLSFQTKTSYAHYISFEHGMRRSTQIPWNSYRNNNNNNNNNSNNNNNNNNAKVHPRKVILMSCRRSQDSLFHTPVIYVNIICKFPTQHFNCKVRVKSYYVVTQWSETSPRRLTIVGWARNLWSLHRNGRFITVRCEIVWTTITNPLAFWDVTRTHTHTHTHTHTNVA